MAWRELLEDALSSLRAESAWHHERLAVVLRSVPLSVEIDDERIPIWSDGRQIRLERGPTDALLWAAASSETLRSLAVAELSPARALRTGELRVRGPVDQITRVTPAIEVCVHGLVRCPSGPGLWTRFLQMTRRDG